MPRRSLFAVLPTLLTACSAADVLNATVPSDTYQRTESLAYGPNPRQQVDVYPPKTGTKNAPMVVFFYGGSWSSGDRADYRLSPEVRYLVFLQDSAQAMRWAFDNAQNMVLTRRVFSSWVTAPGLTTQPCWRSTSAGLLALA